MWGLYVNPHGRVVENAFLIPNYHSRHTSVSQNIQMTIPLRAQLQSHLIIHFPHVHPSSDHMTSLTIVASASVQEIPPKMT